MYLLSAEDSHQLACAKGRCSETHGRLGASRCLPPSPNAAAVAEQRRKSKRKPARSVPKLFRSFLSQAHVEVTRGHQSPKLASWIFVRKCAIGTGLLIKFWKGASTSHYFFTLRHFTANVNLFSSSKKSKLFCNTTVFGSLLTYRCIPLQKIPIRAACTVY